MWRWDGFRAWAKDASSSAAMRLEQVNRLEGLKQELEQATVRADAAQAAHEALTRRLAELSQADKTAREARREADQRVTEATRALNRAESDCDLARNKLESLSMAVRRYDDEMTFARQQVKEAERGFADLPDLEEARGQVEDIKLTVEASRMTMMAKRSAHDEVRREGEARLGRSQRVTKELSGWRHRLETAEKRSAELVERRESTEEELSEALERPAELAETREELSEAIEEAETRRKAAADALAGAETKLRDLSHGAKDADRLAGEAREARARAEARTEAARDAVRAAEQRIAEEQDTKPAALLERLAMDPDDMPDAEQLETDIGRLKRQRDSLGAVNLRAEEDAIEVQTEHDTLVTEKSDLEEAIKTLRSGISSLNREGRERLLTAFEQVNSNFSLLFTHLFGGGEANLVMVESDDPLDAGLEIMCQPPGKKLSTLSLLSGGEQTLTAMALIFAVFLSNPAPICVLDEVDAPLDDANVTRFCDLLDEMCRQTDTRFLIITHHAVTMARMDRLFGVTMQEKGVSQLVSVDLKKAEALVA
jgi:chromosome segregation protein